MDYLVGCNFARVEAVSQKAKVQEQNNMYNLVDPCN